MVTAWPAETPRTTSLVGRTKESAARETPSHHGGADIEPNSKSIKESFELCGPIISNKAGGGRFSSHRVLLYWEILLDGAILGLFSGDQSTIKLG